MSKLGRIALALALVATPACGAGSGRGADAPHGAHGPVQPVPVSAQDFAPKTYQVLVNGAASAERRNLLVGVVRHQLARATQRFAAGRTQAGLAALLGAFYLVRAGEYDPSMVDKSTSALLAAAAEMSRIGDEGRAIALYTMLAQVLPAGRARQDVEQHLDALKRWTASTRSNGPMQSAGAGQQAAVQRSLLEPTTDALEQARVRATAWVQRALASDIAELPIRTSFEREEAIEAYRALRAGGATLVALYLRHGSPRQALEAIEKGDLVRVVPPGLRERLERASADDDPQAWEDLFRLFDSADQADRPETALNAALARAATFGIALELYRSEPNSARGATPLAALLVEYGMAEVAPHVLSAALGREASAQEVSWSLSLVLRAMLEEEQIGQLDGARRTFENAAPLIALAEEKRSVGKVRPSAARLRYMMGALEMRSGHLHKARPLLEAAARAEPSLETFMSLAAIDRQKDAALALRSLASAVEVAKKAGDPASEAEAWIATFEIQRDRGDAQQARSALQQALERALESRQQARNSPTHARAERLLARVLEHYEDVQGTRRATQRAYEASESDLRQLTATVLDASRRALTRGDLGAARHAVRRAIEAKLADEDIVYAALWLKLLERKLGALSDGTVEEAFATIDETSGWPAKLRAWGRGRLTDADLLKAARDRVQRTEALFYAAMATHAAGKSEAALPKLREVAQSEAIELVEVIIARDLIAQHSPTRLALQLPKNVDVP